MQFFPTAFTLWNAAFAVVCMTQLIPSSLATEGTCSPAGNVCTDQSQTEKKDDQWKACDFALRPSKISTLPNPPDVWQKTLCWDNEDAKANHDLIIIGAGIGGAYLANKLRVSKKHNASIALMEAGPNVGGRLMSSFSSGALGMSVRPFDKIDNVAPPEYGGMRVAPTYPLVFAEVMHLWNREFKSKAPKDAQCDVDFCSKRENYSKCCPGLLVPMDVGRVRYHNTNSRLGKLSMDSKLTDCNPLYNETGPQYNVSNIAQYNSYPAYVQCLLLAVGAESFLTSQPEGYSTTLKDQSAKKTFSEICSKPKCNTIPGFCDLCDQFPNSQAAAVTSCMGYDLDVETYPMRYLLTLTKEAVNLYGEIFLYLVTVGYQRLTQSILSGLEVDDDESGYKQVAVAPHYMKKLVAIGVGPGDFEIAVNRARVLAQRQVERFLGKPVEDDDGPLEPIQFLFSDGSMSNSHMSYLTMLPIDAVGGENEMSPIRGLEPWREQVLKNTLPNLALKAVIEWEDFSLSDEIGMIPCLRIENASAVDGSCDRIILDGNADTRVVRQAWPWDYKQILLYALGGKGSAAERNYEISTEKGLEALLKRVVGELQEAVEGIESQVNPGQHIIIPQPSWFRVKIWPMGSLLVDCPGGSDYPFSGFFRRPFGNETNVWYGNSEVSRNCTNHGWAEGALEMVTESLPEIETTMYKYVKQDGCH